MSARRRIHAAKIRFISLVPKGANRVQPIYKADSTAEFDIECVVKGFDDEKGELTAVVYVPELTDSHGDIASADVIKDAMYEAAKSGFNIDIHHDLKPVGKNKAFVAESFIVQKGDPRFADMKLYDGSSFDPTGAWGVVVKIEDKDLREQFRSGKLSGVSMWGAGKVETLKRSDSPSDKHKGEDEMTPEQLTEIKKSNETLATTIITGFTDVLTKCGLIKKDGEDDKNKKKGEIPRPVNPTKANLTKWMLRKRQAALAAEFDAESATADDILAKGEELEQIEQEIAKIDEAENAAKEESRKRASNQPGVRSTGITKNDGGNKGGGVGFVGLAKGDESDDEIRGAIESGARMASFANAQRGYAGTGNG